MKKLWLLLAFFLPVAVTGQTYTAATCNYSDVNAIVNGPTHVAVNGDTIIIPAGTCTWNSTLSVSGVGIDITGTGTPNTGGGTAGAGTSTTNLIDNAHGPFISFSGLAFGQTARIELLNLAPVAGAGSNTISVTVSMTGTCTSSGCPQGRFDNLNFAANQWETPLAGGFISVDNIFGVADHNTATESTTASPALVQVNFDAWKGVGAYGDNSFADADTSGTASTMFMENNLVDGVRISENDVSPGATVGGARYVCRFNTVRHMSGTGLCSAHGTAWGGRFRGQRQVEVYYNTVAVNGLGGCNAINGLNSGTGFYLSNTISTIGGTGGCNEFEVLDIARFVMTGTPWNSCDGTQPWDQSPWSSTTQCLDQPGRGPGALLQNLTPVLASAPSTPCTTPGQCWPNPSLRPVYEAGETLNAGATSPGSFIAIQGDGTSTRVLLNRDAYAEVSQSAQTSATSPFNGTSGTGYGTLARRPTTCTAGVGYWATDQGTWNTYNSQQGVLYVCSAGTWSTYYTPYTYPHPLEGSGGGPFTLSTSVTPTGGGTLTCTPSGSGIIAGTSYSCSTTTNSGFTLFSISGCGGTQTGSTFAGTMPSSNCTVTATFNTLPPPTFTWTPAINPSGSGSLTGTNCGAGTYASGTTIGPCTAVPGSGFLVATTLWTGVSGNAACSGSTNPCPSFVITSNSGATANFTPQVATPAFSPTSLSSPGRVTISTSTPGATIYYTVDGSTPTTSSAVYTHPLLISHTLNLKALGVKAGSFNSNVGSAAYTLSFPKTRFSLTPTSSSSSPVPYPPDLRACCGSNVAALNTALGTTNFTILHNWITAATANGSTFTYTIQGFPTWMTGLSNVESAPPSDLHTSTSCAATGTTTTDCSMKSFVIALMKDRTGLASQPSSPTTCAHLDYLEIINEFNTDSVGPSSTGWTGTYADLAQMGNDISTITHLWCSNTVVIGGSASAIVGFHSNGENGHYDIALETLLADWSGISGASLPDAISVHLYPSRNTVTPMPMPTTIVSNSDASCTSGNTPNVSCYIAVKDEVNQLNTTATLQNTSIVSWAKYLSIYSTEGGFGEVSQLGGSSTTTIGASYVAESMMVIAAGQNASLHMLYAADDSTWGCYWNCGSGNSAWLFAYNQMLSWLNGHSITGPLTSTAITGGNQWSVQLDSGAAELDFCDAWLANCTTSTSFNTQTTLAGVTSPTSGSLTLNQEPVLLTNGTSSFAISSAGTGTGSFSGSNCVNSGSVTNGTVITCTATAGTGSTFTGFSGTGSASGCSTSPCTFTLGVNTTLTGTFTLNTFTLTVTAANGTVSGTNCASGTYNYNTAIGACSATPNAGFSFTGWSGAGSCSGVSGTGTASCTLTSNSTLTATFVSAGGPKAIMTGTVTISGKVVLQ